MTSNNISTKMCPKCRLVKPVSEFYKQKRNASGYTCYCKDCIKAQSRDTYNKDPDKCNARNKAHYAKNRERYLEKGKIYNASRKEQRCAYDAAYYHKNIEKKRAAQRIRQATSAQYHSYQKLWRAANKEKIKEGKRTWIEQNRDRHNAKNRAWKKR